MSSPAQTVEACPAPSFHHSLLQRWWPAIEGEIASVLPSYREPSPLEKMTAYQLGTGGKRLRALLPLQVAQILGCEPEKVLPFAAACEVLHNASLVLDDIQDGDSHRRDHETLWRHFGMPQSINGGVAMMFCAPLLVQRVDAPAEVRERLLRTLLETTLEVIQGQSLELDICPTVAVTWDQYVEIAEGKTGGLLALPMVGTAMLSGAPETTVDALDQAARHLAVLFQVQDDIMDLWGAKGRDRVGNDIREGKPSALVVFARERLPIEDADALAQVLKKPRDETSDEEVTGAIALFESCGARDRALDEIRHRRQAMVSVLNDPAVHDFVLDLVALVTAPIVPLLKERSPGSLSEFPIP